MAGNSTCTPLLSPAPTTAVSRRPSRLRPLFAFPRASSSTPRKNHLRPKLLKTLTKPVPLLETAPIPATPPPPPRAEVVLLPEEENIEVEEFVFSEAVGPAEEYGGSVRRFSATSVLKFGGYLLGVLLFQAVAAVVVTGIQRTMKEETSSYRGGGVGEEVGLISDEEVMWRVMEIREMARKVRDEERKRREKRPDQTEAGQDFEDDGDDEGEDIEEKESLRSDLSGFGSEATGLSGLSAGNGSDPGVDLRETRVDEDKREAEQATSVLDKLLLDEDSDEGADFGEGETSVLGKKLSGFRGANGSDPEVALMINDAGALQEASVMSLPIEVGKTPCQLNSDGRRYPKAVAKSSDQYITSTDSVNGMNVGDSMVRKEASDARVKQADVPTDMWWSKLPYVLAILMRRGPQEDKTGLFVLRLNSTADGEQGAACTLAFEDRFDANNFCSLLEAYFEGLDNFSADIVPLTTQELQDSINPQKETVLVVKKGQLKLYAGQSFADELQDSINPQKETVLVVKKGQLKLYAGQSFADVESALRSLL